MNLKTAGSGPAPEVLHVFASFAHGGVPIRIANVLNHIGAGFRHVIVALDGNMDARSRLDPDLAVELIFPDHRSLGFFARMGRIAESIRKFRPAMLITYNWGSIEWALVNRFATHLPHIHMESGFGPEEADRQIRRRVLVRRIALGRTRTLLVPSRNLVRIARDVWRIPAERISYIPNGVDCARFDTAGRTASVAGFERRPGDIVTGTVAPLRREKNLGRLIRAFAGLAPNPRHRLLIVGDGAMRGELEALAESLGVAGRVVFAGHVEAVEDVLGLIDVFAITSDTEQMPNALLQAMAAGRPVAGVAVGDIADMVAEANRALIVPRDDEAGLRAAMDRINSDAALRDRLGRANRDRARSEYSLERMLERYEETLFAPFRQAAAAARKTETTA